MKTTVLLLTLLLSAATFADAEKRYLTDEEVYACEQLAVVARIIQDIRVNEKVEVWDFYYKHPDVLKAYSPELGWYLVRKVYSIIPETVHPAQVYRQLFLHCTKYTFDSKPELEYNL